MSNVYYHNITHDDMLNGYGLRTVLWLSGCEHRCKGCQNPITWNPEAGALFDEDAEKELWMWLDKEHIQGITFSGGDPLHPSNREKVGELVKKFRQKYGDKKDIWLYTGYSLCKKKEWVLTNQKEQEIVIDWLPFVDVLVDGRFEECTRKKDILINRTVHWRGSSNQRIIDVKETVLQPTDNIIFYQ